MGYQIDFKDVLLPGWKGWDGDGVSDIPGKDVTLNDGENGSILLNSEGISVYNQPLDVLYEVDMGEVFLEHIETVIDKEQLKPYLSDSDIEESILVLQKYLEREATFK